MTGKKISIRSGAGQADSGASEKLTEATVSWAPLSFRGWNLLLAATSKGLCFADAGDGALAALERWAARHCPGARLIRDDGRLRPWLAEYEAYFRGERAGFAEPVDLRGTPFQLSVWRALREIPRGETRAYSDIACRIGMPNAVRAAAAAIGANPALIAVPCHRIIGKDGSLTGYRCGLEMKEKLLRLELSNIS